MSKSIFIKANPNIFRDEKSEYFDPKYWQSMQAIEGYERGRGTTWFIRHDTHSLVLRHFYRGGFMSRFNRDRYIFSSLESTRAFKEFTILDQLYREGLPVPEPAGARVVKEGKNYTADLISFIKEHVRHGIIWTEKNWAFFHESYKRAYSRQ